jgi:8-oxo-dGTP pyrophosphatase MutT (NUDIX family)
MVREFSAGGVVVTASGEGWMLAAIEPQKDASSSTTSRKKKSTKAVLALPKGLVDEGEKPDQTAVREVLEETGLTAALVTKLMDIKYVYVRSWSDQQRVFKIVSFYLLRHVGGRIDDVAPEMRIEVKRALWIPLAGAEKRLAYGGEREVVRRAQGFLSSHPNP